MRLHLLSVIFLLTIIIISCKKEEKVPQPIPEKSFTNDSLTVRDRTAKTGNSPARSKYNLLGFGYDVTGEFADSASAREPVVDIDKYRNTFSTAVQYNRTTSVSGSLYEAADAAELSRQVSYHVRDSRFPGLKEQEEKRYFKM